MWVTLRDIEEQVIKRNADIVSAKVMDEGMTLKYDVGTTLQENLAAITSDNACGSSYTLHSISHAFDTNIRLFYEHHDQSVGMTTISPFASLKHVHAALPHCLPPSRPTLCACVCGQAGHVPPLVGRKASPNYQENPVHQNPDQTI